MYPERKNEGKKTRKLFNTIYSPFFLRLYIRQIKLILAKSCKKYLKFISIICIYTFIQIDMFHLSDGKIVDLY